MRLMKVILSVAILDCIYLIWFMVTDRLPVFEQAGYSTTELYGIIAWLVIALGYFLFTFKLLRNDSDRKKLTSCCPSADPSH